MKNNRLESIITQSLERFYSRLMPILNSKQPKESGKGLTKNDLTDELKGKYDEAVNMSHGHANKNILDNTNASFTTALKSNYDDAVNKSHTHSNKTILDNTNESFTTDIKTQINTNKSNISTVAGYINDSDLITDSESKMIKLVPTNANHACGISMVGGRTQKFNQICNKNTLVLNGSVADNYAYDSTTNTISFKFKGNNAGCYQRVTTKSTDKYYIRTTAKTTSTNSSVLIKIGLENSSSNKDTSLSANVAKTISFICTPETKAIIFYFMNATSGDTCSIQNTMIINLTEMFGSGNEPTTEEFEAMFPEAYYQYTECELWNAPVESIVSIGKNFSPINRKSITASDGGFLIGTTSYHQSINLFSGKYIISYNQTESTGQTEFKFYDSIGNTISKTITNSSSVNVEITFDKPIVEFTMYCNKPTTITNFMIRLYNTDSSYVPYNKTTLLIPDSIKSLPDYGLSVSDEIYNYVDFENMVYHHRVMSFDIGGITFTNRSTANTNCIFSTYVGNSTNIPTNYKTMNNMIVSSHFNVNTIDVNTMVAGEIRLSDYLYIYDADVNIQDASTKYRGCIVNVALATEELIDISDMLMPIRVETDGTITFSNEHNLDIPNSIVYKKEVSLS